jgi:hypothetical protein
MEELNGRALSECLQDGASRESDLPGESVRPQQGEQGARRRGKGLIKVQGKVPVEEGAPKRRTEEGTRTYVVTGGNKVELRGAKRLVRLRKGVVAICCLCEEGGGVQRS